MRGHLPRERIGGAALIGDAVEDAEAVRGRDDTQPAGGDLEDRERRTAEAHEDEELERTEKDRH